VKGVAARWGGRRANRLFDALYNVCVPGHCGAQSLKLRVLSFPVATLALWLAEGVASLRLLPITL
jgi:hypothetical protein